MIRWLVAVVLVFIVQIGLSAARPTASAAPTRDPGAASEGGTLDVLGRLGGSADSLHINGAWAYVLSGSDLISLDIADPAHPRMVARSTLPATPGESWFAGNYLFYTGSIEEDDQIKALSIIDLRDPLHPVRLSRYTGFQPASADHYIDSVHAEGNYLYLLSSPASAASPTIHVIDLADPAHPTITGRLSLPAGSSYHSLIKHGAYLYFGYGTYIPPHSFAGGLMIANVANPAAPALVGAPIATGPVGVPRIAGQRLYVQRGAYDGNGSYPELAVLDISDPTHPAMLGHASAEAMDALGYDFIAAAGQYAFLLRPDMGPLLAIVDTTTPAAPTLAATIAPTATTRMLAQIHGGYGYLLHETEEQGTYLQTVDLHNPAAPAEVGRLPLLPFQQAGSVVETNGALYALTGGYYGWTSYSLTRLRSYDLRDPANPVELDSLDIGGSAENMRESQGYLYIGASWAHVTVVDARDPSNLRLVGTHEILPDFSSPARIVAISGRLVYIDLSGVVYIVDYAQIDNPQVVRHLGSAGPLAVGSLFWSLSLYWNNGYYLSGRDMTNPADPAVVVDQRLSDQLSAVITSYVNTANMVTDGSYLYITTVTGWLQVIDISDPAHPVELPLYRFSQHNGGPRAVVDHGLLYIQATQGLTVVDVSQPAHPRTVASARLSWDRDERGLDMSNGIIYLGQHQGLTVLGNRSGLISGRVRQVNGQPFAGASIHSSHADSATSDAQGAYQLRDAPGTPVRLTAALSGYAFWPPVRSFTMTASVSGQDFTITPAPVSVALEPGGPTPLTITGTHGLATTLVFTPSASTTVRLTATPLLHPVPFGQAFAGHSWTLSASPAAFASPARVSIAFSQADVRTVHTRASLGLWRWSGSAWVPAADGCGAAAGGVAAGTLSGALCQGGEYALLGPSRTLALPIIRR
jgi:hypothetical protein